MKDERTGNNAILIGYARNFTRDQIDLEEATFLLESELRRVREFIELIIPPAFLLNNARQTVVVYLCRLGGPVWFVEEFTPMLNAIESFNFNLAAEKLNDTTFARRNEELAILLSTMMRTGKMT